MHIHCLRNWISCSHITPQQQHSKRNITQHNVKLSKKETQVTARFACVGDMLVTRDQMQNVKHIV